MVPSAVTAGKRVGEPARSLLVYSRSNCLLAPPSTDLNRGGFYSRGDLEKTTGYKLGKVTLDTRKPSKQEYFTRVYFGFYYNLECLHFS